MVPETRIASPGCARCGPAVAVSALDDFGVAGNNFDARRGRGLSHGIDNRRQLGQRKALFEDEAGAEETRLGSRDGKVVHCAVYRQFADGSAGKKERLHDERVGTHGQAASAQIEHRGVAQVFQLRIAKGGQKQMFHQFVAQLAAASVAHDDRRVIGEWQRTGPARKIGGGVLFRITQARFLSLVRPVSLRRKPARRAAPIHSIGVTPEIAAVSWSHEQFS
jgi:hypothetical protein